MTGTYHIWPISAGLITVYLFSLAGIRMNIYSRAEHRQFWNVLLLVVFMVAATLGLFFAFQINYKIDFKAGDTWMMVHVDFGIALAVTAILHFTWHISYYLGIFKRKTHKRKAGSEPVYPETETEPVSMKDKGMFFEKIPVFLLGFTALITQVVLLRSFLNAFDGNELVIGIVLGNWMLLTGFGAWLGRKASRLRNKEQFVFSNLIWLGILPLATTVFLYFLKNLIFIPGSLVGLFAVFLYSLGLLLPFCVLSGYSFSLYTLMLSDKVKANLTGRVYAWEAVGSLAGGLLFSFFLVFILKSMQVLSLVLLVNLIGAYLWRKEKEKKESGSIILFAGIIAVIALLVFPVDRYIQHFLYPNQQIIHLRESPFGNLVVTRTGDQTNLFENGVLAASTLDPITNEEDVHYAMLQRTDPKSVLLISGGVTGMIREILKYPVDTIDYLEINPWIVSIGRTITRDIDLPQVHVIIGDARRYIRKCDKKYDIILIHSPPPTTAQINRYFTRDFYLQVKKNLSPGGVVSFGLPASPNYVGAEGMELTSLMFHTLQSVFPYVEIVPGEKNYFLASDAPLSLEIARLVQERGIKNDYVSPYYIDDNLLKARNLQIMDRITPVRKLNTDLNPVAYFRQISLWLSYYRFNTRFFALILGGIFIFLIIRSKKIPVAMFTGGFAASAVEFLLLFVFQILSGHVYLMISLFVSLFMAGIALGSLSGKPVEKEAGYRNFRAILFRMGFLALIPPVYLISFHWLGGIGFLLRILLFVHIFAFAFLTGRLFILGSRLQQEPVSRIAASMYGADLAGGALGALVIAGFLIPLAGVAGTSAITGAFCFIVAGVILNGKR
ncbi:MAG: hypothetical protein GXO83_05745 [Chlorobi bacterium]|nr:hypothetical protein [Chlorobiota bacterium]